jgi:hypothetical protein
VAIVVVATFIAAAGATPPGKNGRIAFTRYTNTSRSEGAILTIGADGRAERRVTRPPSGAVDQYPDWSRDGSRIVFERCARAIACRVGTVGADGRDLRFVTRACGSPDTRAYADIRGPAFSADGRQIVVGLAWGNVMTLPVAAGCPRCGADQIEHFDLVVMNADGTNVAYDAVGKRARLGIPSLAVGADRYPRRGGRREPAEHA